VALTLPVDALHRLDPLVEAPEEYWQTRSELEWN
jgi:hypothetical protein